MDPGVDVNDRNDTDRDDTDRDERTGSVRDLPVEVRYRDLELIGSGGLGEVHRAVSVASGEQVAIKVVRAAADPSVAWRRVRRELTALVALSGHPHVVQLVELVDVDGSPGVVMEYAPHGSVARFVADPGGRPAAGRPATLPEVVLIARHAAAALVAAHEHGIVHRDVKPQNLLVAPDGRVVLCDFGVAALARSRDLRTRTDALSLGYASPEELDDGAEVTAATDVYSLGATLLHLVHGAPPSLKERLAPWVPPPAGDARAAALDALVADCLHPDPGRRPTSSDLLTRLERLDWTLEDRIIGLDVSGWPPIEPIGTTVSEAPDLDTRERSSASTLVGERRSPPRPAVEARRRVPGVALAAVGVAVASVLAVTTWWVAGGRSDPVARPAGGPAPAPAARSSPSSVDGVDPSTDRARLDDAGDQGDLSAADLSAADLPGPGLDAATGDGTGPVVIERPTGLGDIRHDVVWPFHRLGECLVQRPRADELVAVDCGEPHDLQRIAVAELDADRFGPDADFDGRAIDVAVEAVCRRSLEAFVGVPADVSIFGPAHTRPGADAWAAGERSFQCLVGVAGRRTIGDAAGAGR